VNDRGTVGAPARRQGGLLTALVVDGIGTGLFLPFAVLYFLHTTTIPLAVVGGALGAAGLLALPSPLLAGPLIDRFGPRAVAVFGNLLCAAAFTGYLFVDGPWTLVGAATGAAVGQAISWTSLMGLVAVLAAPRERPHWFAVQSAARNAGYGVGGIAGAVAVSTGGRWAYPMLAAVNAASYLVAALLVTRAKNQTTTAPAERDPASRRIGYRDVVRSRGLMVLVAANFLLVICMNTLAVLAAVYLTVSLGQPAWLGGGLFTLNTILVLLTQTAVTRRVSRYRGQRIVQAAAAAWFCAFVFLWLLAAAPNWLVLPGAVLAVLACTLAEMLHAPTISALAVDTAPTAEPGRYLAVYQLSWSIGSAVTPALLTWLLSRGPQWPWPVLIAISVAGALVIDFVTPRARTRLSPSRRT
jgi:MFS family permease